MGKMFIPKSLSTLPLDELYGIVQKRIETIDFDALWPGFAPVKYALYNEKACFFDGYFVENKGEFMANTSIEYQGEQIAIWHVEPDMKEDADTFASLIVHEMFHAFQTKNGETRFADELKALPRYHYSEEALSLRYREGECMHRLLKVYDEETFEKLLSLRRTRLLRFPFEYKYEACNEQIEGSAHYVELKALAQLQPELAVQAWERLGRQLTDTKLYFPVRPATYASGACLFRILAERYERSDNHDAMRKLCAFTDTPFATACLTTGSHSADGDLPTNTEKEDLTVPAVKEAFAAYKKETRRMIDTALENNEVVLEGDYIMVSPNIYDARFDQPYLTSRFFIAYKDGGEQTSLRGDFVIEMTEDFHIAKIYRTSFE